MAGESPGARRHQQKRNGRRELPFNEQRSSNKYYKSKQISAITPARSDKKGRPGTPPKPNPTPKLGRHSDIPQTADKKYYSGLPQAPTLQQIQAAERKKGKKVSALPSRKRAAATQRTDGVLCILEKEDVREVMSQLPNQLDGTTLVIEVGSKELLRRARTALDLMVTREEISEDEARDVQFSLVQSEAPAIDLSKPPEPTSTVSADADDEPITNIDDVLSGKVDLGDDDGPSTAPQDVVVEDGIDDANLGAADGADGADGAVASDDDEEEEDADDDGEEDADDDDDDAPAEASTEDAVADSVLDPDHVSDEPEAPVLPIRSEHGDVESSDDEAAPPSATHSGDMEDSGAVSVIAPQEEQASKPKRRSRRSGRGSDRD